MNKYEKMILEGMEPSEIKKMQYKANRILKNEIQKEIQFEPATQPVKTEISLTRSQLDLRSTIIRRFIEGQK
jgi:hypothetical protein